MTKISHKKEKINQIKDDFEICLILNNIRSVHNVGSIFRIADCAGINKIYCVGTTPLPIDRFGRQRKDFAKVSLGAEKNIISVYKEKTEDLILELKEKGIKIIAIEQSGNSVDYKEIKLSGATAFILGNEVDGISPDILNLCDDVSEIKMLGKKESLNVAVAFGISIFRILNI